MDKLVTGFIRSTHGVEGCVKIESASGEIDHLRSLTEVTIKKDGASFIHTSFNVEYLRGHQQCLLLKLKGIDTLEQAKKLVGGEILVPRDKACPLAEGEFYVRDLCQCNLVYNEKVVGKIHGLIEGGAGDLLEVLLTDTVHLEIAGPKTRLVPFRKEFIGKVDIPQGLVELKHRWILE